MSTPEAQRKARKAYRDRKKEAGEKLVSFMLSVEAAESLPTLMAGGKSKNAAINAALIAAAKGAGRNSGNPEPKPKPDKAKSLAEKPRRGRGVHFNEAMAEVSSTKPKLDTSTVSIHPDLQKERKK